MLLVRRRDEVKESGGLLATIGFFDGVHLGHRFLIREMKEAAGRRALPTAVITFPRHPRLTLQTDYQPKLLNSFEEKIKHLAETGVDYCIVLDFTPEVSQMTAETFIASVLSQQWGVTTLFVGYDHRFGRDRADGFGQYARYAASCGMETLEAGRCFAGGKAAVSSSEIRKQLALGKVDLASMLLTYPYQMKGHIVQGNRIGRTLGFPTANIRIDEPFKVLPCEGVYAVWVALQGKRYKGMLYIGRRPTLDNGEVRLEVHILDFGGDIYDSEISVAFIRYVRSGVRFHSPAELKEQLKQDRMLVAGLLKE
jgi:riboflavin kinase/FMN adenylyltransferase